MIIRKIKKEDDIKKFLLSCWLDSYIGIQEGVDYAGIKNFFATADEPYPTASVEEYGAFEKGVLVGYIGFLVKKDRVILKSLYVNKNYQGKGIGSKLIEKTFEKKLPIYLSVIESNKKARNFYEKHGFQLINEKVKYPLTINGFVLKEVVYQRI